MQNNTKNKIKPFGFFITQNKEKLNHANVTNAFAEVHNKHKIMLVNTATTMTNENPNLHVSTVYNFNQPISNSISQLTDFPIVKPVDTIHKQHAIQPLFKPLYTPPATLQRSRFTNFVDDRDYIYKRLDEVNINKVYRRNIKIIYNVYQEKYTHNIPGTGFGDFIRGCYCLINFCEKFKFQYNIIINHPLSNWLNEPKNLSTHISKNINYFQKNNCDSHVTDKNNIIITNTNGDEIDNSFKQHLIDEVSVLPSGEAFMYTIAYPYHKINDMHRNIMRQVLKPSYDMMKYISYNLKELNLKNKQFMVIHLRTGDTYLNDPTIDMDEEKLDNIYKEISEVVAKNNNIRDCLLITDNINIRAKIIEKFGSLKTLFNDITHFGEGLVQYDEPIKNTLLEFYLIACSNKISSFTCYIHGSGFSKWCAETYNIPYTCKLLK